MRKSRFSESQVEWADERRIDLHYIQPGKPDQNAFIERFNRSYRTEVLNAHLFESLAEVRALTEGWLVVYNQERPHDSLGRVPPLTFLPRLNPPVQSPFAVRGGPRFSDRLLRWSPDPTGGIWNATKETELPG